MAGSTVQPKPGAPLDVNDRMNVQAELMRLIEQIPVASGDGVSIIGNILAADDLDALLGEPEESLPNAEDVEGRTLSVKSLRRADSTYEVAPDEEQFYLPWFLIIESTDTANGETVMWQTNATSVVAKLAMLYTRNGLPADVETRKATKKTKRGYYPMNLIVHKYNKA